MIWKSSAAECMLYFHKTFGAVQDKMQLLENLFKMIFKDHKECNSVLQTDAQETCVVN